MSSNQYGMVVKDADIPAILAKWDWTRKCHVLTETLGTDIPDLEDLEHEKPMTGSQVKTLVDSCDPERIEVITWGTGGRGLSVFDGNAYHYVNPCVAYPG